VSHYQRERVPILLSGYLRDIDRLAAPGNARLSLAASDHREALPLLPSPLPILSNEQWQARLRHEAAHAECSRQSGAQQIEALIRDDGTGWCESTAIGNPLDAITVLLVGVAAEAKYRPSSIHNYARGCYDLFAARILIDKWNGAGEWPPLTCENAARTAVEFVESRWKQINALAMVLGSAGTLTDYEVRLFSLCAR